MAHGPQFAHAYPRLSAHHVWVKALYFNIHYDYPMRKRSLCPSSISLPCIHLPPISALRIIFLDVHKMDCDLPCSTTPCRAPELGYGVDPSCRIWLPLLLSTPPPSLSALLSTFNTCAPAIPNHLQLWSPGCVAWPCVFSQLGILSPWLTPACFESSADISPVHHRP